MIKSEMIAVDCSFLENQGKNAGGGIYAGDSKLHPTRSRMSRNSAEYGGAIALYSSELNISDTIFIENEAKNGAELERRNMTTSSCIMSL